MRVGIVGSRGFSNLEAIRQYVAGLDRRDVVVSGGAAGVDSTAAKAAIELGMQVAVHEADWKRYGKAAGMRRNTEIVKDCDRIVAFWDGSSRGTRDTIEKALVMRRRLEVYFE